MLYGHMSPVSQQSYYPFFLRNLAYKDEKSDRLFEN
jgi:hypothetical protein